MTTYRPQDFTYSPEDRQEFDRLIVELPDSQKVLAGLLFLKIRHDLAGVHGAVAGYEHFLTVADTQQRQVAALLADLSTLPATITEIRLDVGRMKVAQQRNDQAVEALSNNITARRVYLDERIALAEGRIDELAGLVPHAPPSPLPQWVYWFAVALILIEIAQWAVLLWRLT